MRRSLIATLLTLCAHTAAAHAAAAAQPAAPSPAATACLPGILAAEHQFALPPKLLQTIGIVESGRVDPLTGRVTPWPWTIDVGGNGQMFATKQAAIDAVHALQAQGVVSIDVGCLQINLMHHPHAFASLDEAFDPAANTQYGAHFLSALYHETGNWPLAAAAYHSRAEEQGVPYETRVMAIWPLARRFPDATLQARTLALSAAPQSAAPDPEMAAFTPEFAAKVKSMRADFARLEASTGLLRGAPVVLAKKEKNLLFPKKKQQKDFSKFAAPTEVADAAP
jgi:hypothetical protein